APRHGRRGRRRGAGRWLLRGALRPDLRRHSRQARPRDGAGRVGGAGGRGSRGAGTGLRFPVRRRIVRRPGGPPVAPAGPTRPGEVAGRSRSTALPPGFRGVAPASSRSANAGKGASRGRTGGGHSPRTKPSPRLTDHFTLRIPFMASSGGLVPSAGGVAQRL